jgi:hypothetical protein
MGNLVIYLETFPRANLAIDDAGKQVVRAYINIIGTKVHGEQMFRIKASYADQMELRTTVEKAREFGEL